MIDKLTYDQVLTIANELRKNTEIINNLIKDKDVSELTDFTATVEGYSKYLENTVGINQDADNALKGLKEQIK